MFFRFVSLVMAASMLLACGSQEQTASEGKTSVEASAVVEKAAETTAAASSAETNPLSGHEMQHVAEGIYVIHGPTEQPNVANKGFMNNPGFVVTANSVVVVDPGSSVQIGQGLFEKIRAVTDKPVTHIFNTHVHGDHWLGNDAFKREFPEVKIYAHPVMIEEAQNGQAENWLQLMSSLTEGATDGTQVVIPAEALSDGQEIIVDDVLFRAHLTDWAHSRTDAMIEMPAQKLLFGGDNILYKRIARMDDGSFRGNIEALERAQSLDVAVIVPGHGPTSGKEIIEDFRIYLDTVYSLAAKYMEEGLQPYEMKEKIVAELSGYKDWPGFEEEVGKHISLAVLEAEQASF